jgi:POT family proton-dependent oligopeptide transporter
MNRRKQEPNTIVKFGLGFLFLGLGFLAFYGSRFFSDTDGLTPITIFCFAYLVVTIGELCLSPIGLSMITTLSPVRLHGVMMGTWFLASAYGQYGAGLIGAALAKSGSETDNPDNIQKLMMYTEGYMHIGIIALVSGVLLILLAPSLRKMMS